jgi:hypothetical protein
MKILSEVSSESGSKSNHRKARVENDPAGKSFWLEQLKKKRKESINFRVNICLKVEQNGLL